MTFAASFENPIFQAARPVDFEQALQNLLQQALENSPSHGIQLHVDSPTLNLCWQGAVGFTARAEHTERVDLAVNHPFRIASNTKTFVAAAILRLWEEQRLVLDHSIQPYLLPEHVSMISKAGYSLDDITIRHLLSHTSGLFDYGDSPVFERAIMETPEKYYTRTEQLEVAMNTGQAYGKPGEVFRYGDTGYILLGEIIEQVSGLPLGEALRELLDYERLGLKTTWLYSIEPIPADSVPLVHQYEGDMDIKRLDPSCDLYGGGGLASTVEDMAVFMRALFEGKLFKFQKTLLTMLSTVAVRAGGPDYGSYEQTPCTYRLGIDGGRDGRVYHHKGHSGTLAAFVPELDLAVALSVNISRRSGAVDPRDVMLAELLSLLNITV